VQDVPKPAMPAKAPPVQKQLYLGPCSVESDQNRDGKFESQEIYQYQVTKNETLLVTVSTYKNGSLKNQVKKEYRSDGLLDNEVAEAYYEGEKYVSGEKRQYDSKGRVTSVEIDNNLDGTIERSHKIEVIGDGDYEVIVDDGWLSNVPNSYTSHKYYLNKNGLLEKIEKEEWEPDDEDDWYKTTIFITRDELGRKIESKIVNTHPGPTKEITTETYSFTYYPSKGEEKTVTKDTLDGEAKSITEFRLNEKGQTVSMAIDYKADGKPDDVLECKYNSQYKLTDRLQKEYGRIGVSGKPPKELSAKYQYNDDGLITEAIIDWDNDGKNISTWTFEYDDVGNLNKSIHTHNIPYYYESVRVYDYSCWVDILKKEPKIKDMKIHQEPVFRAECVMTCD